MTTKKISDLTVKSTPAGSDELELQETAAGASRKATLQTLVEAVKPPIASLTLKATPTGTDELELQETGAGNKRKATLTTLVRAIVLSAINLTATARAGSTDVIRTTLADGTEKKITVPNLLVSAHAVDWYGAVGDGVATDSDAIISAITAAGTHGAVLFTPGKTYLIDRELNPNHDGASRPAQRWIGYGAKIKRCDQVSSTTATNIQTGLSATTFAVASSAGFRVGMFVNIFNGSSYDGSNHQITVINGNNITVSTAFTTAFPTGGTVVSSLRMIVTAQDNFVIEGLELDGNRSNNTLLAKWDINEAAFIAGNRNIIRYCYIHDEVGEGIVLGGSGSIADTNWIEFTGGNGIHFTGGRSNFCTARSNKVRFTNLGGSGVGHPDGGIILSDNCTDVSILDNYIEGTGYAAFGSIDENNNRNIRIIGNAVRNCASLVDMAQTASTTISTLTLGAGELTSSGNTATVTRTGIVTTLGLYEGFSLRISGATDGGGIPLAEYAGDFRVATVAGDNNSFTFYFRGSATPTPIGTIVLTYEDDNAATLVFSGNNCSNSGRFQIESGLTYGKTVGPKRVIIANNIFHNCYLYASRAHDLLFSDNQWFWDLNTTQAVKFFNDCTDIESHDVITGGNTGATVQGSNTEHVAIRDTFKNQYTYGTYFSATLPTTSDIGCHGATFIKESGDPASGYNAVWHDRNASVKDCKFQISVSGNCIRSQSASGGLITGNLINNTTATSIFLAGSTCGCIVKNNKLNTVMAYSTATEVTNNPQALNPLNPYTDVSPGAGATLTPDTVTAEIYNVTLPAGNITIANPTTGGKVAYAKGHRLTFNLLQDGVGGRTITWGSDFIKAADGAGTASQRASTTFISDGAKWLQQGGAVVYG